MICFDVTLKGFNGDTDATDHLVKWVLAHSEQQLNDWLHDTKLENLLHETPIQLSHQFNLEDKVFWKTGVDVVLFPNGDIQWRENQSLGVWMCQASD